MGSYILLGEILIKLLRLLIKAYVTSTQLYNWRFTPDELANQRHECNAAARTRLTAHFQAKAEAAASAASSNGCASGDVSEIPKFLTAEEEFAIVKRYIFAMKELFLQFEDSRLPAEVFGFAATYLKRFYLNNSVMDYFPREMMLTALYLACKVADYPLGLNAFTQHIPRNRDRYSYFISHSELFLMEKLQYDIWIHAPYRPLSGFLVDLLAHRKQSAPEGASESLNADLMAKLKAEGYDIIHDWYQTDLCLTHPPSQIALAVLMELGRIHPELEVEEFVKNEVCGCASGDKEAEDKWVELREKIEHVQTTVIGEFDFLTDLSYGSELEMALLKCRNPLYDPLSEEYAAARKQAEELMAFSD